MAILPIVLDDRVWYIIITKGKEKRKGYEMNTTGEVTKLYVLEEKNGEKHFFASVFDRNRFYNRLETWEQFYSKRYEIELTK